MKTAPIRDISIHRPSYTVKNLRMSEAPMRLGPIHGDGDHNNRANFPTDDKIDIPNGDPVAEVINPFPFWGATYILVKQAEKFKEAPESFRFKRDYPEFPNHDTFIEDLVKKGPGLKVLPRYLLLSIAQNSKNPLVLAELAKLACDMEVDGSGRPLGLIYHKWEHASLRPSIHDKPLFETVANNPHLPDEFKRVMVLNPGAQGENPIVGEFKGDNTHVWEYLRKNSYIPWGHYASNMAHDAVRYRVDDLSLEDMKGLRFLYYQRIYTEVIRSFGQDTPSNPLNNDHALEDLRQKALELVERAARDKTPLKFSGNLWGWNYGYGYASMGYRLHASHQQIHNQYALVPEKASNTGETYIVGDLVWEHLERYRASFGRQFFEDYMESIRGQSRIDGSANGPKGLMIFEDENIIAYCPRAQRSQGEVHLLVKRPMGNVLEADTETRRSLDQGILKVMKGLSSLGAEMITVFEVSKRYHRIGALQHLFYCFLPRHEDSPGSMSEAQGRWITGHWPEDFAWLLRTKIKGLKMA